MDTTKYMKHLPTCNMMQDWSEAEAAFADTPTHFRDGNWNEARHEMDLKRNTCTCGLIEAIEVAKNISSKPMLAVSCRFCDAKFEDEYALEAHMNFNHK